MPPAGSPEAATGPTEPATPGMLAESDYGAAAWAGPAAPVAVAPAPPVPGHPAPGAAPPGTLASAGHSSGAGHHPAVGVAPQVPVARRRGGWPPWLTWVLLGGGLLLFLALALIVVSAAVMAQSKGRRRGVIAPTGGERVAVSVTYRGPSSRVSSST